jgi:hypothetical protein
VRALLALLLLCACGEVPDRVGPRWGIQTGDRPPQTPVGYWTAEDLDAHADALAATGVFPVEVLRAALPGIWAWPITAPLGCPGAGHVAGCMLNREWLLVEEKPCKWSTALTHELVHSVLDFLGVADDSHADTELWRRADVPAGTCEEQS